MSFNKFLQISIAIMLYILIPLKVGATILYLESSQNEYQLGDTFIAELRINVEQGECINTAEIYLSSEPRILEVKDFSKGDSIISLWLKEPEFSKESGLVSFIGGIPGGYCGLLPGDPGKSNLLGTIIFEVRKGSEITEVKFLDSSQILLNDGLGTPAELEKKGKIFTILAGSPEVVKKEWQERLEDDKIPPEPFGIEIRQDSLVFEGEYFLTFLTSDKQTGIDHYEVREGRREWKRAVSPYLLEDQNLQSIIGVKAVDKAGNERIVEYEPTGKPNLYWLILIFIVILIIIFWKFFKRRRNSANQSDSQLIN